MSYAIDAAIATQLRSGRLVNSVWWDKPVPDKDSSGQLLTQYLEMRANTGLITADRLAGPLGPRTKTYYLTGIGTSPGEAAWVLEQATAALLNFIPVISGWSCHRMLLASSQSVDVDPDLDNRYFGVDVWDVFAQPISA